MTEVADQSLKAALHELADWFGRTEIRVRGILERGSERELWFVEITRASMQYQGYGHSEAEATWQAIEKARRDIGG